MKWNRNILHDICTIQVKLNRHIQGFSKREKTIYTHDQSGMKKFILWNVRDEKIYFVKYKELWVGLCEM